MCTECNGVVSIDIAGCFKAEDVVEVDAFCAAVNIGEVIRAGEAGIVLLEVGRVQKGIGIVNGGNVHSSESLDETILMGTVGAFDPTFGLGRMRVNDIDPEVRQRS